MEEGAAQEQRLLASAVATEGFVNVMHESIGQKRERVVTDLNLLRDGIADLMDRLASFQVQLNENLEHLNGMPVDRFMAEARTVTQRVGQTLNDRQRARQHLLSADDLGSLPVIESVRVLSRSISSSSSASRALQVTSLQQQQKRQSQALTLGKQLGEALAEGAESARPFKQAWLAIMSQWAAMQPLASRIPPEIDHWYTFASMAHGELRERLRSFQEKLGPLADGETDGT